MELYAVIEVKECGVVVRGLDPLGYPSANTHFALEACWVTGQPLVQARLPYWVVVRIKQRDGE